MAGFVLRVRSSFCLVCAKNNWKNTCVLETALFSLFSTCANHEGGEVFILYPGLNWQLVSMVTAIFELDYSLLKHVVINDDLEFCLWDMSRQGGS